MEKFSYGLGMGIGQNLLSMGVKNIDVEKFVNGIKAVLTGEKTEMTHSEAQKVVNEYFQKLSEEAYAKIKEAYTVEMKINIWAQLEMGKLTIDDEAEEPVEAPDTSVEE